VPDGKVPVPGAARVRYFRVSGETYDQLMSSIGKKTRRFCGRRGAIACVVPLDWRFTTQTMVDPETGACTISGLDASVGYLAHIPRWMEPSRVSAPLAWWWRQVAIRAGWRQAQHVRILEEHLATLQDQVVGRACSDFDGILDAWVTELERAQAVFAARDDPLQAQAFARWLREAGGG
jgi:predicted secreted Zn-dependent protease